MSDEIESMLGQNRGAAPAHMSRLEVDGTAPSGDRPRVDGAKRRRFDDLTRQFLRVLADMGELTPVALASPEVQRLRDALGMTAARPDAEPVIRVLIPTAPALAEITISPGGSLPREVHPEEDETIYIVRGRALLKTRRQWVGEGTAHDALSLEEGEAARVPASVEHHVCNPGTEALRVLVMLTPKVECAEFTQADVERMVALGDPSEPAARTPPTPEELEQMGAPGEDVTEPDGMPIPRALRVMFARGSMPCGHPVSALMDGTTCSACLAERGARQRELDDIRAKLAAAESERMKFYSDACRERNRAVDAEEALETARTRWRETSAPLAQAIRALTVGVAAPGRQCQAPCTRCHARPSAIGGLCADCDCDDHGDRAELNAIRGRSLVRLCLAAEAFFGSDFSSPAPSPVLVSDAARGGGGA